MRSLIEETNVISDQIDVTPLLLANDDPFNCLPVAGQRIDRGSRPPAGLFPEPADIPSEPADLSPEPSVALPQQPRPRPLHRQLPLQLRGCAENGGRGT